MTTLLLDPAASRLTVRTRATGVLARFAHDLELVSSDLRGKATLDGETWTAELVVPVASLQVAGALHGDVLDRSTISPDDRAEIQRKLRDEVLSAARDLVASAAGPAPWGRERPPARTSEPASSRARGEVSLRAGGPVARFPTEAAIEEREGGAFVVKGKATVTLSALGVRPVKGPLGAFKVNDAVEVLYDLTLRPAEPTPAP